MESVKRNENVDLLRLISIIFIVCIHYVGWGGAASTSDILPLNFAFTGGIAVACNCAVNCFYMISGYYINGDETFETCKKRIIKVWIPTFLYSVGIPMILLIVGEISLNIKQIIYLFFPVMSNQYWFSTVFIATTLVLPYLGQLLNGINREYLLKLVIILILIDCVQPLLGCNAFSNIGYGILHSTTMYVIGYTIKREQVKIKRIHCGAAFLICVVSIGMITVASVMLIGDRIRTIADYNSPLMVLQSVAFFLFFMNIKIKKVHFSKISPYIFGVYLLNDNAYAREFLWQKIFHCQDFYSSYLLPLHFIITVFIFVVIALTIEYLRINIWKRIRSKLNHG